MVTALTAVPNADVQSQGFLTNSAFRSLHRLGDFGNRGFVFECIFKSRTSSLVQATRLRRPFAAAFFTTIVGSF
jgi:hypothetical protein